MPTRLIILGARGRMGQTLISCASRNPQLAVVGEIDMGDDLQTVIERCDVVIDFSFHEVTSRTASICSQHKKALVIGTTGHTPAEQLDIKTLQKSIPIVWSSNYSTGKSVV